MTQKFSLRNATLVLSFAALGAVAGFVYLNTGTSQKSLATGSVGGFSNNVGIENGSVEWSFSGAATFTVNSTASDVRSGSKSLKMATSGTLDSKALNPSLAVSIPASGTNYVTVIAWMKGSTTGGEAAVGIYNVNTSVTTKAVTVTSLNTSWQRISYTFPATNGHSYYPILFGRSTSSTSRNIFYDDVVIYTSTSSVSDNTIPNYPTAVSISSSGTSIAMSWAPGTDAASGIDGYLVLRSTGVKLTDTVVQNQVNYSTNSIHGPTSIQSWQVVYTGIAASFTDNPGTPGDYTYMLFSRDKAFNYSIFVNPTRAVVMNGASSTTTLSTNCILDGLYIGPGNSAIISPSVTIQLWAGAIAHIHGTLTEQGIFSHTGAFVTMYNGSLYRYNKNGSSSYPVMTATWNNGSECRLDGITNTLPGGLGQSFFNFVVNNSAQTASLSMPNGFACRNDLTIQSTGTGSLTLYSCTLGGDLYKTGGNVSFHSSSALSLNGSASQIISMPCTLRMLSVNNASGVVLNAAATITDSLLLVSGRITTDNTNILTLGSSALATGGSAASYVAGPLIKTGAGAFTYPVGDGGIYKPLTLSANGSAASQFRVRYYYTNPDALYSILLKDPTINNISKCEYWNVDLLAGTPSARPTVTWDPNSCGVFDTSSLTVARWNGSLWTDEGHGPVSGNNTTGFITSLNPLSAFGPVTLASYHAINPLPVELTSFTISCEEGLPTLKWITASEKNNHYFSIERSENLSNWNLVGKKQGAGNSTSPLSYTFTDLYPLKKEKSYYRLVQTDYNGKKETFGPLSIACNQEAAPSMSLHAFQDADNTLTLRFSSAASGPVKIMLVTVEGRLVYSGTVVIEEGSSEIPLHNARIPARGIYVLQAEAGDFRESKKLFLK